MSAKRRNTLTISWMQCGNSHSVLRTEDRPVQLPVTLGCHKDRTRPPFLQVLYSPMYRSSHCSVFPVLVQDLPTGMIIKFNRPLCGTLRSDDPCDQTGRGRSEVGMCTNSCSVMCSAVALTSRATDCTNFHDEICQLRSRIKLSITILPFVLGLKVQEIGLHLSWLAFVP